MDDDDKQAIIEHLANTQGLEDEVMEEYEIGLKTLTRVMQDAGFDKCDCGRWTPEEESCGCDVPDFIRVKKMLRR